MNSNKKKVVVLTSVHPFNDTRIFYKECLSLSRNGYEVTLICPSSEDVSSDEITIKTIKKETKRVKRILFSTMRIILLAMKENADFYHFHDPELIPAGIILRFLRDTNVIYDIHEDNPSVVLERSWIPSAFQKILSLGVDKVEKFVSRYFDALITADDAVANRLKGINSNIIILYNFPDLYFYENCVKRQLFQYKNIRLVYIGVISESRGLWLMLDAIKILINDFNIDNLRLHLAGKIFNENVREEFQKIGTTDPIYKEKVVWLGRIPQERVIDLLDKSDIGWIPFLDTEKFLNNIPTKQFEYMARGIPIVGSDLPPIRKYVIEANAGLLAKPNDPKSHAREIYALIKNKQKANLFGKNGMKKVKEEYNWHSQEKKLLSLYKELT